MAKLCILNNYLRLMAEYYNVQKFKINEDKTALMINSKPRFRDEYKDIKIETAENFDDVYQSEVITILGYKINKRGTMDTQIAKTVGECHSKLNLADKQRKYLCTATRARFVTSVIISRINYILPFVSGETEICKRMIVKLMNRSARFIRNDYCFKERLSSIYKSIGLKQPDDMINQSSAKFIHKILYNEKPKQIYKLIKQP